MKIEDQVTSVGPSKELKELGVKQDSLWYWTHKNERSDNWSEAALAFLVGAKYYDNAKKCSAYTVAELGEMLKQHANNLPQWNKYNMGARWFSDIYIPKGYCQVNEETEADARAKMWIYLKKEKIIK